MEYGKEGRRRRPHTLGEARVAYEAAIPMVPEMSTTKLSGKNQVTLPVAMTRYLGLRPGDDLDVILDDEGIRLRRRRQGRELLDWLQGALAGAPEWRTKDEVDAWVREGREWEPTHGVD